MRDAENLIIEMYEIVQEKRQLEMDVKVLEIKNQELREYINNLHKETKDQTAEILNTLIKKCDKNISKPIKKNAVSAYEHIGVDEYGEYEDNDIIEYDYCCSCRDFYDNHFETRYECTNENKSNDGTCYKDKQEF